MKKNILKIGLLLMVIGLFVTGCGKKVAISAEDFKTKMSDKGFVVQEATDQFSDYDYIKKVYVAVEKNVNYQIEFYELDNEENASKFFATNKQIFENNKTDSSAYSETEAANFEKYNLKYSDKYQSLSRIDNTVIYVDAKEEYSGEIKDIIKDLGY